MVWPIADTEIEQEEQTSVRHFSHLPGNEDPLIPAQIDFLQVAHKAWSPVVLQMVQV
jgi:hypothetical protein